jgi:hypothetical protein
VKGSASQPGACLNLDNHKPRRHERIRNVGGEAHLEPIHPQRKAERPAHQEVKPVHRKTTDEYAERHSSSVAACARVLSTNAIERAAKSIVQGDHPRPSNGEIINDWDAQIAYRQPKTDVRRSR